MSKEQVLEKAVEVLRGGGTILYPTDTIWGIGCDASNPKAVEKIYLIKERVTEKSMILLACDLEMLTRYVKEVPDIAVELMASVSDPLTIIYPDARNLPKNVIASDGSVAIRIPRHDFCLQLVREFGKPITSTSANISGSPNPFSFSGILDEIKESVDYVVPSKYQSLSRTKPSTIIKISEGGEMQILRN